jgi:hypothetical protein
VKIGPPFLFQGFQLSEDSDEFDRSAQSVQKKPLS